MPDDDFDLFISSTNFQLRTLESPVALQGSEPQALEQLGSTLAECTTALLALKDSLVAHVLVDDQTVWRFKHPTIGDAYATTLAFSPDLLGIFLSGSSTENLLAQVTCGNVDLEKAVVVPKVLFPKMISRLRAFAASSAYKVGWLSTWAATRTLYRFLAGRCSKEFLTLYLAHDPDLLKRVAHPSLSLWFSPEVDLALRLHKFGLLAEEHRKTFIDTIAKYAIQGEDLHALKAPELQAVFTEDEYAELVERVRTELLPRLGDVRKDVQSNYNTSDSPDDHMQGIVESISTLKELFGENEAALRVIEQEESLAQQWIAETDPPESNARPRTLGAVETSEGRCSTRSIFDDIDACDT